MVPPRRAAALGIAALLAGGCFYPADRGRALEAKVDKLTAQGDESEQKINAALPRVDEKLAQVEKALDGLDKASRRTDADIGVQLQKTIEDMAQLRGQVETYLHRIAELEAQLKTIGDETERRFTEFKGSEAGKAAEAKRKAQELKRPTDKREFLQLADAKAKEGDGALARTLYAEALKNDAWKDLHGEAHFGLGETYYVDDKCREALFEYGKVIQEHPRSRAAPNAYVRSADCFKKLKMNEESRIALEELVRQYPRSEAAKTAKTQLQELEKQKKSPPAPGKKGARR